MPIVFAQPDPMAPDVQAAGGAAEQWSRDMPSLARLYEAAMQGQTQASIAAAHISQQAAAAHSATVEQANARADALQEQARQFDVSQQASPKDVFHAQAQFAMQQQQAQLHAWLNQQDLSQAEAMKLQRMQNAVGEIMADPNLSDEEKTNMAMQLKTGIDPLHHRVEMQKAKLEEELVKKAHHTAAMQQSWEDGNDVQRAKLFEAKKFTGTANGEPIMNPETGKPQEFFLNHQGEPRRFPQDATDQKGKGEGEAKGITDEQLYKHLESATKHVDQVITANQKAWDAAEGDEKKRDELWNPESMARNRARMIDEEMKAVLGIHAGLVKAIRPTQKPPLPVATPPPNAPPGAVTPPPPDQTGGGIQPVPPKQLQAFAPFDWTGQDTTRPMAPAQRQWVGEINDMLGEIARRRQEIPEATRWAAEDSLIEMKEMLGRRGSYSRMTDDEKKKYDHLLEVAKRVPKEKFAEPTTLREGPPPLFGGK